jgi:hypothetical protein
MLPRRGDIVKLDIAIQAQPVRSGYAGTSLRNDGNVQTLLEGTLLRYLRTKNDVALVQIVNPPKVRKMVRQIHPETRSIQSFVVDAYALTFHCKKEDLKWS